MGYGFVWIADGLGSVLLPVRRLEIHRAPQVGDVIEMTLDLDRWGRWCGRDGHVIG